MPSSDPTSNETPAQPRALLAGVETLLIFLVFLASAGWPVPEPNESHYLGKAKHYWNHDWLAGDFFLNSADPHAAFYVTTGWLARYFDLPDIARWGRVVTWTLLAFFWRRLSWSVIPRWGAALVSAALFVALNERFQMAGEWVIGGFEAKGLAYALVLGALAEIVRGKWNLAWLLLGGATAFHVLVGGWSAIAVGTCWLVSGAERPRIRAMLPGIIGFAILSTPTLLESFALTQGASAATLATANDICVFRRLPHHLLFYKMDVTFRWRFAALVVVWGALVWFTPADPGARRLRACVWASLGLAAVGVALGLLAQWEPEFAARWLRFYWFRLADVFVPLGVALTATQLAWHATSRYPRAKMIVPLALFALGCGLLFTRSETPLTTETPRADKPSKTANLEDWRDVCGWVKENTPEDARFFTPRQSQTFRWYANRSEVVTIKDMPQDAAGLVEWWDRLEAIHGANDPERRWHKSLTELDPARLTSLGEKYGAGYVVTEAEPALDLPCVYRNPTYAVYQLPAP